MRTIRTKVWAHRGASCDAPENTMEAFRLACEMGAEGIELDVHQTLDGSLVVAHDETIDRCSDGRGRIADLTLEQLKAFDFSAGKKGFCHVRIPTLDEVLAFAKRTGIFLNIEIKTDRIQYEGIESKVVAAVAGHALEQRVIYSSFNHYSLLKVRQADKSARIGLLYSEALIDPHLYALHLRAEAIHPYYPALMVPNVVKGCRENGIRIHAWTCDLEDHISWLFDIGVDAVITNRPDKALQIREALSHADTFPINRKP